MLNIILHGIKIKQLARDSDELAHVDDALVKRVMKGPVTARAMERHIT